jgi:DNA-binding GntR family transcriptional regulator
MLMSETTRVNIRSYIRDNKFAVGDRIPSEQELSEKLGVSRLTVREAISALRNEGIVHSVQGKGTFVTCELGMMEDLLNKNQSITEMVESGGYKSGVKVSKREIVQADAVLAKKLNINEGENIILYKRIRTANEKPVVYSEDYLAPSIVQAFLSMTDDNESLYRFIEEKVGIVIGIANTEILPAKANAELAEYLKMKEGDLLMEFRALVRDVQGNPIIYADEYLKPDSFKFMLNRI